MVAAPVGWQCVRCVKEASHESPARRWRAAGPGRLGATRITPVVLGLIALDVAIYLWEQTGFTRIVDSYALWPDGVYFQGQWYRLITAAFLHANVEHIAFNMLTLAIVGPPVEAEVGKARFLSLYLASALGGSVCSYLLGPPGELGLGASGAIFGVMGAYFVLARGRRWETSTIVALIVINLVISFATPGIDWRAHVGGLVTGGALGAVIWRLEKPGASGWGGRSFKVAAGVAAAAVACGVLAALAALPPGKVSF
jgi:membrane associated rhomboid family serine protease